MSYGPTMSKRIPPGGESNEAKVVRLSEFRNQRRAEQPVAPHANPSGSTFTLERTPQAPLMQTSFTPKSLLAFPPRTPVTVEHLFAPVIAPDFEKLARLHRARIASEDQNDKVAARRRDATASCYFEALESFATWRNHLYHRIITHYAFLAGREDELTANYAELREAWEAGTLSGTNAAVDTGLAAQFDHLRAGMFSPVNAVQMNSLEMAGLVIEALTRPTPSDDVTDFAHDVCAAAHHIFLQRTTYADRVQAALALQRTIPALSSFDRHLALFDTAQFLCALMKTDATPDAVGVVKAYGHLMCDMGTVKGAHVSLTPRETEIIETGRRTLAHLISATASDDMRNHARLAFTEMARHFPPLSTTMPFTFQGPRGLR